MCFRIARKSWRKTFLWYKPSDVLSWFKSSISVKQVQTTQWRGTFRIVFLGNTRVKRISFWTKNEIIQARSTLMWVAGAEENASARSLWRLIYDNNKYLYNSSTVFFRVTQSDALHVHMY